MITITKQIDNKLPYSYTLLNLKRRAFKISENKNKKTKHSRLDVSPPHLGLSGLLLLLMILFLNLLSDAGGNPSVSGHAQPPDWHKEGAISLHRCTGSWRSRHGGLEDQRLGHPRQDAGEDFEHVPHWFMYYYCIIAEFGADGERRRRSCSPNNKQVLLKSWERSFTLKLSALLV